MKVTRLALLFVLILSVALMAFGSPPGPAGQEANPADPLSGLPAQLAVLGGIASLVPVLVSLGKIFGLVKDGTSRNWSTGLNLAALIGIYVLQLTGQTTLIPQIDQQAGGLAQFLVAVLIFTSQVGVSKLSYAGLRNTFLGFSFSGE